MLLKKPDSFPKFGISQVFLVAKSVPAQLDDWLYSGWPAKCYRVKFEIFLVQIAVPKTYGNVRSTVTHINTHKRPALDKQRTH